MHPPARRSDLRTPRRFRSTALLLGAVAACLAQPLSAADPVGQIIGKAAAAGRLPYMLYLPNSYNTDAQATFPLVVCLGGVSEVGNGSYDGTLNESGTNQLAYVLHHGPLQLIRSGVTFFSDNPTIVIHPENPNNNYSAATIDATITQVATAYRVDPSRIYVTGYSLGGGGAWLYGQAHAARLAALVPIAGASYPANPNSFASMSSLPVWAVHNALDGTVPAAWTTGTTTAFTPNLVGWVSGIAAGQGGINPRCLDNYPGAIGFTTAGAPLSPKTITGVNATRSGHYHPSLGWGWNDGTVFVGGDYTQVTIINAADHNGWDATYGTGSGSAFNTAFWTWLLAQRQGLAPVALGNTEVVVDDTFNSNGSTTSASGTWSSGSSAAAFDGTYAFSHFGTSFTFHPNLPATDTYQAYIWYSGASGVALSTVVPVTVFASGVTTNLTIDEAFGAGHWVPIGIYQCASGTGTAVTIGTAGANGAVSADAVRFVRLPGASVNTPPTVSLIGNQTLTASATVTPAFTIGDAQTAAANLSVQATAVDTTLLPPGGLVLGGSGASRTLAITPATGLTGSTSVVLTVTDDSGLATSTSFTVTVTATPGDTPPTISGTIPDQNLAIGGSSAALAFTVGDAETAASALVVTRSSSNPGYLPVSGLVLGGSGASRTVTVTPAPGQSGSATVTLTVIDGGGLAASKSFSVTTAAPANTPPTITNIIDQVLPVGGHSSGRAFTIGDAETAVTSLVVTATSSNPTYLPNSGLVLAGTGASRSVTISTAAGQSGSATVTLTVTDGGGLSAITDFLVSSTGLVGPTISTIPNQSLASGSASPSIPFTVTDPAVTTITMQAGIAPSGALDCAFSGAAGSRSLVITPAAGVSGAYQVTVTAQDANGLSASRTFTATVTSGGPGSGGGSGSSSGGGGGGSGGGCGLGSGAYALTGLFMLALRSLVVAAWRRRD